MAHAPADEKLLVPSGGDVADPGDSPPAGAESRSTLQRAVVLVGIAIALVPVFVVVARYAGRHYFIISDEASIDLRVRDVFTTHTPLVGPHSRGFNHPGPLLFWMLAPLSWLAGGAAWATRVGGALWEGVAIAAAAWLAFRRGGMLLALGVLATLGLAYTAHPFLHQAFDAWNPDVAFPFFLLFLLQAWSVVLGSRWQVVGGVVTANVLVQLHASYAPLVVIIGAWAATVTVVDHRRRREPLVSGRQPSMRAALAWSAVATVAVWIFPLYQQLADEPGNLHLLVEEFQGEPGSHPVGFHYAAGVFARAIPALLPGGADQTGIYSVNPANLWWLLVPAAFVAIGVVAARATGRRADSLLVQLAAVNAVATIVTISRIRVDPSWWLFFWRSISAWFVVLAGMWAVAHWVRLERRRVAQWVAAGSLLVVITATFAYGTNINVLDWDYHGGTPKLFAAVRNAGLPTRPVLVRGIGESTSGLMQGFVDDLEDEGVDVRVDPQFALIYGKHRTAHLSDVDEVWYVSPWGRSRHILDFPDARVVASVEPLPAAQEAELRTLQRELTSELTDAGRTDLIRFIDLPVIDEIVTQEQVSGVDRAAVERISQLNTRVGGRCRCIVVAFSPERVPDVQYSGGW